MAHDNATSVIGFDFYAEAGVNYGERYGVYIETNQPSETQRVCESGDENYPGPMSPLNNYALLIDCL